MTRVKPVHSAVSDILWRQQISRCAFVFILCNGRCQSDNNHDGHREYQSTSVGGYRTVSKSRQWELFEFRLFVVWRTRSPPSSRALNLSFSLFFLLPSLSVRYHVTVRRSTNVHPSCAPSHSRTLPVHVSHLVLFFCLSLLFLPLFVPLSTVHVLVLSLSPFDICAIPQFVYVGIKRRHLVFRGLCKKHPDFTQQIPRARLEPHSSSFSSLSISIRCVQHIFDRFVIKFPLTGDTFEKFNFAPPQQSINKYLLYIGISILSAIPENSVLPITSYVRTRETKTRYICTAEI